MNITLQITPAVQAELARQAAASGRALEIHAASLLEEAVHLPPEDTAPNSIPEKPFGQKLIEVFSMIKGLADDVDFSRDRSSEWRPLDLS